MSSALLEHEENSFAENSSPVNFFFLVSLALTATLNSLIFGLVLAATNSCQSFLNLALFDCGSRISAGPENGDPGEPGDRILLNNCTRMQSLQQFSVAAMILGAGAGSLFGGQLGDKLGRRGTMLYVNAAAVIKNLFIDSSICGSNGAFT